MAPASSKRARYGTKKFIKQVLESPASKDGLKTSELVSKVQELAGKKIPSATVFQAAKSLVKERALASRRDGREFRFQVHAVEKAKETGFQVAEQARQAIANLPPDAEVRLRAAKLALEGTASSELSKSGGFASRASEGVLGSSLPHKLDPGQVLVLGHDEKFVTTLTNVHGRPIVERHPINKE